MHANSRTFFEQRAKEHGHAYLEAGLASSGLVLHSGTAVGRVLTYADDGSLQRFVRGQTAGAHHLGESPSFHVIAVESSLTRWSQYGENASLRQRYDNVNSVLREFAVDGAATRATGSDSTGRLLRDCLKTVHVLSACEQDGESCYGVIDVPVYNSRMRSRRTAALADGVLINEMRYAEYYAPKYAANGVQLRYIREAWDQCMDELAMRCPEQSLSLVMSPAASAIVLDPHYF